MPGYNYAQWFFLDGRPEPNAAFATYLFTLLLLTTVAAALLKSATAKCASSVQRRLSHYATISVLLVWVLMTPVSSPIWQILPALQKVQFPWRVAVMLDIATAMLVAAGVHCILDSRSIWRWSGVLAALLLLSSTYLMENKSRAFLFDKLRPANLRVENAWVLNYRSSFHSVQSLPRWAPRISLRDETELARLQERPLVRQQRNQRNSGRRKEGE